MSGPQLYTTHYPKRQEDGSPPILEFKNHRNSQQHPLMIVADTEALLINVNEEGEEVDEEKNKTITECVHEASCVGMHVNRFDGKNSYFEFYGKDCMQKFVKKIEEVVEDFVNEFYEKKYFVEEDGSKTWTMVQKGLKMRKEETQKADEAMKVATKCHICDKEFSEDDKKVRDQDHFTGKFRGITHNRCNLQFSVQKMVPVLFHNLNYDTRMYIRDLVRDYQNQGYMDSIAKSQEDFVSHSKLINVRNILVKGEEKIWMWEIRFFDSHKFLNYKLEALADNLPSEKKQC